MSLFFVNAHILGKKRNKIFTADNGILQKMWKYDIHMIAAKLIYFIYEQDVSGHPNLILIRPKQRMA